MTVTPLPRRATGSVLPSTMNVDSFRHVTAALARCATETAANDPAGGAERHKRLARAIHANMELWAALLHRVLGSTSALPPPLRDHLVELAGVSIRHCSHVLRGDAAVDPLIVVNRSIIDGLPSTGGKQAAAADR